MHRGLHSSSDIQGPRETCQYWPPLSDASRCMPLQACTVAQLQPLVSLFLLCYNVILRLSWVCACKTLNWDGQTGLWLYVATSQVSQVSQVSTWPLFNLITLKSVAMALTKEPAKYLCIVPRPTMQMTSLIRGVVSGQPNSVKAPPSLKSWLRPCVLCTVVSLLLSISEVGLGVRLQLMWQ